MEYIICFCFIIKSFTIKGKHYLYWCLCELISENWMWSNSVTVPQHHESARQVQSFPSYRGLVPGFEQYLCHLCSISFCAKDLLLLKVHTLYYFLIRIMSSSLYSPRCGYVELSCFLDCFFLLKKASSVFSQFEVPVCGFSRLNTPAELFSARDSGLACRGRF